MPLVSIVFGGLLIALGAWGYVTSESKSVTALIPAMVGALLAVLGAIGLVERMLKHAMHAAAMIGLIGLVLAGGRLIMKLAQGAGFDLSDRKTLSMAGMVLLCAVFVGLCVNSFIQARRRRRAAAAAQSQVQ
jgi:hypothetical protein